MTASAKQKALRNAKALKSPAAPVARVIVNTHAVSRLRAGHPWIFRSDIERLDHAAPGALVPAGTVHARTSSGPTVKNEISPSSS